MDLYKCFLPCILLLLVVSGALSEVSVVNGTIGGSVFFYVSVPSATTATIWQAANNVQIAVLRPDGNYSCLNQFTGRCEGSRNGSLRLDNIKYTDQGEYKMFAQNVNFEFIARESFQLNIYAPLNAPVLSVNSTSDSLVDGTYVTLRCNASNQTVHTYTFYRGQKNICSEPHVTCTESFLHFQPIRENDNGTYTCTIQNPVSTNTSNSLLLTVIVPVSEVNLSSNTSSTLLWPGKDSVSLHCSANGTNVIFSWSLQGAPLPVDPRYHLTPSNSTLVISPVSTNDNGPFICTASNSISSKSSNEVKLNLASPVSEVILSSNASEWLRVGEDSVSLHCSALGSAVRFSWTLNGQPIPQDPRYNIREDNSVPNAKLTISPVSRNDNGPFTCTASNLANSETSNALNFSLAWLPGQNILCTAQPYNQNVQLICSWPGGQPAANVTMIFDNVTQTNHNQVTRNLSSNNNVHGSNLTCNGDQLGKTSSCTLKFEPPQSPGHDNSAITRVTAGQSAVMKVNLTAGLQSRDIFQVLPAEFTWFHLNPNPTEIQNGNKLKVDSTAYTSSLQIYDATQEENGTYECRANNLIGNTTFRFTLNVAVQPTSKGLDGGEIAGIVIGVLAGVTIIGIVVFFIVKKKNKKGESARVNEPDEKIGEVQYANIQLNNNDGGIAETSITNNPKDKDEVNYAELKFTRTPSTKLTTSEPVETVYSDVKNSNKR